VNRIRAENPAMRDFTNIRFWPVADGRVLYYSRFDEASRNFLLFHVLVDPHSSADFAFEVPLWELGLPNEASVEVEDAIHGNRFTWHGIHHRLALDPVERPYAVWKLFPPGGAQ
jgi:starch synthase (maltosyl-transferring)